MVKTALLIRNLGKLRSLNPIYPKPNLSKGEQKIIEELAKRKDIIISNADKGGTVVIMDVEKYIKEGNGQLSNKRN